MILISELVKRSENVYRNYLENATALQSLDRKWARLPYCNHAQKLPAKGFENTTVEMLYWHVASIAQVEYRSCKIYK